MNSDHRFGAMIVGSSADEFIRYVERLLSEEGIAFVHCEDVYSAVGKLAQNGDEHLLIVGRLRVLNSERGRFFHIARENGSSCCCLLDGDSAGGQEQARSARAAGAFVVSEPAQVPQLVEELRGAVRSPASKGASHSSTFIKDEFRTTKAELDALLGPANEGCKDF